MPKRTISFLVLLALFALILGLNYVYTPFQKFEEAIVQFQEEKVQTEEYNSGSELEQIFSQMDEKDKIGQLLAVSLLMEGSAGASGSAIPADEVLRQASQVKPGFFTIFGNLISVADMKQTRERLNGFNQAKIEPWFAVDHEGGQVQRLNGKGFTTLDSWYDLCNTQRDLVEAELKRSAIEIKNAGIDVVFAPVIDVGPVRPPLNERLCSTDPNLIARQATLFMNVFKTEGILPVLKHFPGIGSIKEDLHDEFAVITVGVEDVYLYNNLLPYFPDVGVMTAHVGLRNQHQDIPCSLSKDCVGELLAQYPTVLVFIDSLEMDSVFYLSDQPNTDASDSASVRTESITIAEIAKRAVIAGNDVLVFGPSTTAEEMETLSQELIREYHENEEFRLRVDESVKKILGYKLITKD